MIEIQATTKIKAEVAVPGSKSITQRSLIAAALADGESTLLGPLESEDTRYTAGALKQMGVVVDKEREKWRVRGNGGRIATPDKEIFLGNNGTATRFLTSVAALGSGTFRINGDARMAERPILPLIQALQGWEVDIASINNNGCPPLLIKAKGLSGGKTTLPAGKSSQYLSSLLLVGPYARKEAELDVEGEILSLPFSTITPICSRAAAVYRVSSLSRGPVRLLTPSARAAAIRARCVMLLEPGTAISAFIFVAGLISIIVLSC